MPPRLKPIISKFYVKERENYLSNYLKLRELKKGEERLKPIIPSFFFQLDRYLNPDADRTPLDDEFARIMEDRSNAFKSPEKLKDLLKTYESIPEETKRKFSGPTLNSLPTDRSDIQWAEEALHELFSDIPLLNQLRQSGELEKKMRLRFKRPLFDTGDVSLREGYFKIEFPKKIFKTYPEYEFDLARSYFLKILANEPRRDIELADVPLKIKETPNEYVLWPADPEGVNYDSAIFRAEIWEIGASAYFWGGDLEISGGEPVIIMVRPASQKQFDRDPVKIRVRDAGTLTANTKLILKGTNENIGKNYEIPSVGWLRAIPKEQTLHYQVFEFNLDDYQPPPPQSEIIDGGIYTLSFKTGREYDSDVAFLVEQNEYEVRIKELKCVDESNPEWWGDDNISFQTFANTKFFVQVPKHSQQYGGYHDGRSRYGDGRSPKLRDADISIYGPDGSRIIEDFLTINAAIYEHDDLGWLAWLINQTMSLVQSWLAMQLNEFTYDVGGWIVLAGLEVSGLNDMREQLVNSIVAGWEVEVLHQGSLQLRAQDIPPDTNTCDTERTFPGKESKYQITFQMTRS